MSSNRYTEAEAAQLLARCRNGGQGRLGNLGPLDSQRATPASGERAPAESASEPRADSPRAPRKYRNKPCDDGRGNRFDSLRELNRWRELELLAHAGEITELRRQVRLPLGVVYDGGREAALVVDFVYVTGGRTVYEDAKGMETPVSKLKRAILRARGIDVTLC